MNIARVPKKVNKNKICFYILAIFLFTGINAQAQTITPIYETMLKRIDTDSAFVYKIFFNDGSEINCTIDYFDSVSVAFTSTAGFSAQVPLSSIKKFKLIRGRWKDNKFVRRNVHSHHLFITPTAETMPAGSFYLSGSEIMFWSLSIAPTDYINLGVGTPIIPNALFSMIYAYAKLRIVNYSGFNLSTGGVLFTGLGDLVSVPYVSASAIYDKIKVTVSFYDNFEAISVFVVGGEIKLSERTGFITENIFGQEGFEGNWHLFGLRYNGDSFGADFGFISFPVTRDNIFFPWLGLYYNF